MSAEERWVGVEEVAGHLQVAEASIYRWVESKGFAAHRVGRLLRFKLSELDEWVKTSGGDDSVAGSPRAPGQQVSSAGRKSRIRNKRSPKRGN